MERLVPGGTCEGGGETHLAENGGTPLSLDGFCWGKSHENVEHPMKIWMIMDGLC